jgi:steroid delta-isomerase-like uncharacterized protein
MLNAHDNASVVRAHYDAFNRRDVEKSKTLVTDDVKFTNIPFNVDFTGPKGYREYLDNWTTAMPDAKVEIVNVIANADWVAVEFVGRGKHTGPLAGPDGPISATYKQLDMKFCELLRLRDGQIAEARVFFDAATMMRQLGILPLATAPVLATR